MAARFGLAWRLTQIESETVRASELVAHMNCILLLKPGLLSPRAPLGCHLAPLGCHLAKPARRGLHLLFDCSRLSAGQCFLLAYVATHTSSRRPVRLIRPSRAARLVSLGSRRISPPKLPVLWRRNDARAVALRIVDYPQCARYESERTDVTDVTSVSPF